MKKSLVVLLSMMMVLFCLIPAVLADSVSLPPLDKFGENIELWQIDEAANCYYYACPDVNELVTNVQLYGKVLDDHYDMGSMKIDAESGENRVYMYFDEYEGSADLTPVLMDYCPTPCYLLIALVGAEDTYYACVMGLNELTFNDDLSRVIAAAQEPAADGEEKYLFTKENSGDPACTLCGGDAVCDTCNGLGYQEKKLFGSDEAVKIACEAGCSAGACPNCKKDCDVCGSDGLCDVCGGLGYLEQKIFGSDDMVKVECSGEHCALGACSACAVTEGAVESIPLPTQDPLTQAHTFAEPKIEAAVRKALGKSTGDITYEDLLKVTKLEIKKAKISDVSDLSYMTNLTYLDLYYNNIIDITPLSGLINLTYLKLCSNDIIDVTPLSGLTNLPKLDLSYNDIIDITPLSGLINLTYLDLDCNEIIDFAPLSGLTNLTTLSLSDTDISDVTLLSGLTNLTTLSLSDTDISDITPLSGLTNLTNLYLRGNNISDITPLSGLTNLENLSLDSNNISDFSPISGKNIEYLDIDNNPGTLKPTPKPTATPYSGYSGTLIPSPWELIAAPFTFRDLEKGKIYNYDNASVELIKMYVSELQYSCDLKLVDTRKDSQLGWLTYKLKYTGDDGDGELKIEIFSPDKQFSSFYIQCSGDLRINQGGSGSGSSSGGGYSGSSKGSSLCSKCSGGRCGTCGGSGYITKYIYGLGDERRNCDSPYCSGGTCTYCGGDGWY